MNSTEKYSTQSIKLSFPNQHNVILAARLDRPVDREPIAYIIMSHCFTCTKETLTTARVSRGLAQQGFGVLRFDFTGLGDSEGNFSDSNFTSMVNDVHSAAEYLQKNYSAPVTLIGHSMGGTAALAASVAITSCDTVITIAAPNEPSHVLHHFGKAMDQLESGQNAEITVAGIQYPVKPQFIQDVYGFKMRKILSNFNKRILAIRAGKDSLVSHSDADNIIALTSAESRLYELKDADHLFSDRIDTNNMISEINLWLSK
ncbi:MAG: alpha/beta fold hydrolase [Gammaproteobacteria bacterium]|nr:alpha/beta fold hydrolase [Gammaproteobacteria bacterium]